MSYRKDGKPRKHWTLSEETKKLLSSIRKGRKFTPEHREKISKAMKARHALKKIDTNGST